MTALYAVAPTFTRPNDSTAYSIGDLVANDTTAANVLALNWKFPRDGLPKRQIAFRYASVRCSGTGAIASKALRVNIFTVVPTFVTGGDNSAISTVVATGFATWLGAFDVPSMALVADGSFGNGAPISGMGLEVIWDNKVAPDSSGYLNLYGFLEARGAYTPAAQETYSVALHGLPVAD